MKYSIKRFKIEKSGKFEHLSKIYNKTIILINL